MLLPLAAALAFDPIGALRTATLEVSVACGFIAFALMVLELGLVSRLRAASRPFGTDVLMQFHRAMGCVAFAFLVAHALLLVTQGLPRAAFHPGRGPWAVRSGAIVFWLVVMLVGTSVGRKRFGLSYEVWQQLHGVAAVAIVVGAIAHVLAVDRYASAPVVRWLVVLYGALFIGLLVSYRVLRPLWLWRRPWTVTDNRDVGGDTRLVRLVPAGAWRCWFDPGQFVWLITGRTPFALEQHPLSLASSAELDADGSVEFAVKALGDWSRTVPRTLAPGTRVWVDGPYGAFTPDRAAGQGLVLIAGGIGVSPMRAMLRTMRDREDHRPVLLVLAARNWLRVPLRDDLATLASEMPPLRIVYVFEDPPAEWRGERGLITTDILRRHLPAHCEHYQYFVCGPPAMMNALEPMLRRLGVPRDRVHTERFEMG